MADQVNHIQYRNSTNVRSAGYNAEERYLEIAYRNGSLYRYFNVPPRVYSDFASAPSKGKWVYGVLKQNPKTYPYRLIAKRPAAFRKRS